MTNNPNTIDGSVLLAGSAALKAVDAVWDSLDEPKLSKDAFATHVLEAAADFARRIRDTPLEHREAQLVSGLVALRADGSHE
jgi:hypothetical protein